MRLLINFSVLIFVSIVLSGCIQSLHPFLTDDMDILFDEVDGDWMLIKDEDSEDFANMNRWTFKFGTINILEEDNSELILDAKYFKIKNSILVNFTPYDFDNFLEKKASTYLISGLISSHSLGKIEIKDNIMTVRLLNRQYVIDEIENGNYNLKFVEYGSGMAKSYIFVSESEEWVDFLNKNINDDSLFDDRNKFVFKKIMS